MKAKENKKLNFNSSTISELNDVSINNIRGGVTPFFFITTIGVSYHLVKGIMEDNE